ncbi:MAG: hypothetical protein COA78_36260, partial [Blastopirellula sp.]
LVVPWAASFAKARETTLTLLCWSSSASDPESLEQSGEDQIDIELQEAVTEAIEQFTDGDIPWKYLAEDQITIQFFSEFDPIETTLERIRTDGTELLVVNDNAQGLGENSDVARQLMRQSPCAAIVLKGGSGCSRKPDHVVVATTDSPHDRTAVALAGRMTTFCQSELYLTISEEDTGEEAAEVGERELHQLLHDARVPQNDHIHTTVFLTEDPFQEIVDQVNETDLILLGSNQAELAEQLESVTSHPVIGLIKRAPPLATIGHWTRRLTWIPSLHPAEYADLIQTLRRGSKWAPDFIIMLGLAAAIATLGLMQDSPATVIGSMLLAPLMTPMIGMGLAIAQANFRLARICFKSISGGFLLVLGVSYLLGLSISGEELTAEVLARGNPNILDLGIAFASAAAAAYAMARPSLMGALAGVAIAVALVPPLCCVGIALAYQEYLMAMGSSMLFATNLVAIILAAAGTFRLMGVATVKAAPEHIRWVNTTIAGLAIVVLGLTIPLEFALQQTIDEGRTQPNAFQVTKSVANAVFEIVDQQEGLEVLMMGRPVRTDTEIDYVVYLVSNHPLPISIREEIIETIRVEVENPEAVVVVQCMLNAWDDGEVDDIRKEIEEAEAEEEPSIFD